MTRSVYIRPRDRRRRAARLFGAAIGLLFAACELEVPGTGGPENSGPQPLERITEPAESGAVHLVRLVQRGDEYGFEPMQLSIAPGDVLRFVMVGAQPESVAFDPGRATPEAAQFIRANSLHLGALLTDPGQAYDVSFHDAPPGRYPFVSLPHRASGMQGVVVVGE
ncbi:MAG: plastocyanin/azurin family copper-binding protein [Gemmatimonadota bacterium]